MCGWVVVGKIRLTEGGVEVGGRKERRRKLRKKKRSSGMTALEGSIISAKGRVTKLKNPAGL